LPETAADDPALQWRDALKALQRGDRKSLLAGQAGGYALLRHAARGAAAKASALAEAEIALAFAHRWAEIRRFPAALRAAAAAALQAEQAAALSTRTRYLLEQVQDQQRAAQGQLRSRYAGERKALSRRHRELWAAAAAGAVSRRGKPRKAGLRRAQPLRALHPP
jgi:hypothetical protein